jgi:hypothetical protein
MQREFRAWLRVAANRAGGGKGHFAFVPMVDDGPPLLIRIAVGRDCR